MLKNYKKHKKNKQAEATFFNYSYSKQKQTRKNVYYLLIKCNLFSNKKV